MLNSQETPQERTRSKTPWVVAWVLFTLLTVPAAFGALVWGASECDPQSDFQILCTPADEAAKARTIGGVLIFLWMCGSIAILFAAQSRTGRHTHAVQECPGCGREVTVGSPTCLGCGYNLVAGR